MDLVTHVKSLYEAFGRGELETIFKSFHPRITWNSNGELKLLPWGATRSGPEAAKSFFTAISDNIEFLAFEPREFFGGSDFITVLGFTRGRMRKTGQVWRVNGCTSFTFLRAS